MTDLPAGDPVVRRANDLATSALDVLGSLLLAAAAGWWAWTAVHPALGLAVAGSVVIVLSGLAQWRGTPRSSPARVSPAPALPGPTDPGPLHVMGR
jgi:hypothetical protein